MSSVRYLFGLTAVLLVSLSAQAQDAWTLERSIVQALAASPELRVARAQVDAREGDLSAARAWPNPTLSLRIDEKLGLEDGAGGADATQLALAQPLPFRQRSARIKSAEAGVEFAQRDLHARHLQLESRVAEVFHLLQLTAQRLELAQERERFAGKLRGGRNARKDPLKRYLSPLERQRLAILHEQAHQEVANAEGKFSEALSGFRALLGLPTDTAIEVAPLSPVAPPASLDRWMALLDTHPALATEQAAVASAEADIDVVRRERLAAPTVEVFTERDYLAGARRTYNGVIVGVQVPLWGLNTGGVARAQAQREAAKAQATLTRRDLSTQLMQSHAHLLHLIEQSAHSREHLLGPAQRLYELTRRSFAAGEANVLALIDSYDTHFSAKTGYLELLHQSWLTAAELRLAAGQAIDGVKP